MKAVAVGGSSSSGVYGYSAIQTTIKMMIGFIGASSAIGTDKDMTPKNTIRWTAGCSATALEKLGGSDVCLAASAKHCGMSADGKNTLGGSFANLFPITTMFYGGSDFSIIEFAPLSIPLSQRLPITVDTLRGFNIWNDNQISTIFDILKETILNENLKIKDSIKYSSKPDRIEKDDWDKLFSALEPFIQKCPPGVPIATGSPQIGNHIKQEGYGTGHSGPDRDSLNFLGYRVTKIIDYVDPSVFNAPDLNFYTAGGDSGGGAFHSRQGVDSLLGTTSVRKTYSSDRFGSGFSRISGSLVKYVEKERNLTILKVNDFNFVQGYKNFQFPVVNIDFGNTFQVGLPIRPIIAFLEGGSAPVTKEVVDWYSISEDGYLQFRWQGDNYIPASIDEGKRLIVVLNLGFNITEIKEDGEEGNVTRAYFSIHKDTSIIEQRPPTTVAPTTVAPTTVAPTTVAPTTVAPTTVAPTTVAPTTVALTTVAPTTVAPTPVAPTTVIGTEEGEYNTLLIIIACAGSLSCCCILVFIKCYRNSIPLSLEQDHQRPQASGVTLSEISSPQQHSNGQGPQSSGEATVIGRISSNRMEGIITESVQIELKRIERQERKQQEDLDRMIALSLEDVMVKLKMNQDVLNNVLSKLKNELITNNDIECELKIMMDEIKGLGSLDELNRFNEKYIDSDLFDRISKYFRENIDYNDASDLDMKFQYVKNIKDVIDQYISNNFIKLNKNILEKIRDVMPESLHG